jgi:drug/metabolite transporter (DMT)-like permease
MLFQIAALAWLFLDEPLAPRALAGMVLAALGTFLVQIRRRLS